MNAEDLFNTSIKISGADIHAQDDPYRKQEINLERQLIKKNNIIAGHLRKHFEGTQVFVVNLISAPGAGKTLLLEKTLFHFKDKPIYVITADQDSMNDANRLRRIHPNVIQINTGAFCRLDADMIYHAVHQMKPESESIVLIENVGNLLCSGAGDLGESRKVVIWSVADGEKVPLKYPMIFEQANMCLINKIDLLAHVDFNLEKARELLFKVNPEIRIINTSITKGYGLSEWVTWLTDHMPIQMDAYQ